MWFMKILVIGGTGQVATFLVPMLMEAGHEVVIGSRGKRTSTHSAKVVYCDGNDVGTLTSLVNEGFDVIIDFPGTAYRVFEVFEETASHIIACGSLWMFGYPRVVPTPEQTQNDCVFESYARRYSEILEMIERSGKKKAVFTAIMPPNICGPYKIPLDTMGGRDIEVHKSLQKGETVYMPDGPEALIGPCDAEDIARVFYLAVENRDKAAGQIFNVGAKNSVTISEFVKIYSEIYGVEIPVERVPWERYKEINPEVSAYWHFYAHMVPDITKARQLLKYEPRYDVRTTLARAVEWMFEQKLLSKR
jgi:nucleoside-diphosphate-sugar epimerase